MIESGTNGSASRLPSSAPWQPSSSHLASLSLQLTDSVASPASSQHFQAWWGPLTADMTPSPLPGLRRTAPKVAE